MKKPKRSLPGPVSFIRQTLKAFHTTGAIAPSSSVLARAMLRALPRQDQIPEDYQVLEVGPGTGPITVALAERMSASGQLQVYEINPAFVEHLKERIAHESCFQAMGERLTVHLGNILDLDAPKRFDVIISGLPFNNFKPEEVRRFLEHFKGLLKPTGTLTFFEYYGLRPLQQPFVKRERRERLKGIAHVVDEFVKTYQFDQQIIWRNLPPARARHLRLN